MLNALKRAIIPVTALVVALLALALLNANWLWLLAVAVPLVLLGIYHWQQKTWTITQNYPVAKRIRWSFYDLRPYLRTYILEDDLHGMSVGCIQTQQCHLNTCPTEEMRGLLLCTGLRQRQ